MNIPDLVTEITRQLATPRLMPRQVLDALINQYQQTEDTIVNFMTETLPTLDDTQLDLLLSPVFTPDMSSRQACTALLAHEVLTADQQNELTSLCMAACPTMTLLLPNGDKAGFAIPEVGMERYIKLLQLMRPIHVQVHQLITQHVAQDDQPLYNTFARDMAWTGRESMLVALIPVLSKQSARCMRQMTDFVRTYRPDSLSQLDRQLESYIRSCESDMTRAGEMSFHDERLKEKYVLHGEGNHDTRHEDHVRSSYLHMMDMGRELRDLLHQVEAYATR